MGQSRCEVAARLRVLRVGDGTPAVDGTQILANASKHSGSPTHRPAHFPPPPPRRGATVTPRGKCNCSKSKAGRELYALRKQTIEPVFGIIKEAMGFRRFSLRGLANVRTEWTLVTLACNLKRLFHLGADLRAA